MLAVAAKVRKIENPSVENSLFHLVKYLVGLIFVPIGKIHLDTICTLYLKER